MFSAFSWRQKVNNLYCIVVFTRNEIMKGGLWLLHSTVSHKYPQPPNPLMLLITRIRIIIRKNVLLAFLCGEIRLLDCGLQKKASLNRPVQSVTESKLNLLHCWVMRLWQGQDNVCTHCQLSTMYGTALIDGEVFQTLVLWNGLPRQNILLFCWRRIAQVRSWSSVSHVKGRGVIHYGIPTMRYPLTYKIKVK